MTNTFRAAARKPAASKTLRYFFSLCALQAALSGCSTEQMLYNVGEGWRREECNRRSDPSEQSRCRSSGTGSYEQYKRERDAVTDR